MCTNISQTLYQCAYKCTWSSKDCTLCISSATPTGTAKAPGWSRIACASSRKAPSAAALLHFSSVAVWEQNRAYRTKPDHVSERKARTSPSSSCCTVPSSITMQKTCRVRRLHKESLRSSRSCAAYAQRCALCCLDRGSLCRLRC